jgi:hypothetical protein
VELIQVHVDESVCISSDMASSDEC